MNGTRNDVTNSAQCSMETEVNKFQIFIFLQKNILWRWQLNLMLVTFQPLGYVSYELLDWSSLICALTTWPSHFDLTKWIFSYLTSSVLTDADKGWMITNLKFISSCRQIVRHKTGNAKFSKILNPKIDALSYCLRVTQIMKPQFCQTFLHLVIG